MSTTKHLTPTRTVTKSVAFVQETMSKAYGMLFSHTAKVKCNYRHTNELINVVCEADGIVVHLVMYDKYELVLNKQRKLLTTQYDILLQAVMNIYHLTLIVCLNYICCAICSRHSRNVKFR